MGSYTRFKSISTQCLIPVYMPFIYLSEDHMDLYGPIGEILDKTIKSFSQFNITYLPLKDSNWFLHLGKCHKGICDGVIEKIYQREAELWFIGAPLDAFDGVNDKIYYGPVTSEFSDMITTFSSLSDKVSIKPDLTTSLNSVEWNVYLILSFVLIVFLFIVKLSYFFESQSNDQKSESVLKILWNLINFKATQSVFRANTFVQRLLLISFTAGLFVVFSHYQAYLNTNLVIKKTVKNIDTLTDLLYSKKSPFFFKYGPTTARFKSSPNPVYKEIWSRSTFISLRDPSSFEKIVEAIKSLDAAIVGPIVFRSFLKSTLCYIQSKEKFSNQIYFSKQRFNKIVWILFYSNQLSKEKRENFNLLAYASIEYGLHKLLVTQMSKKFKFYLRDAATDECKVKNAKIQSFKAHIIELVSLKNLLIFWLIGNVLAIILSII